MCNSMCMSENAQFNLYVLVSQLYSIMCRSQNHNSMYNSMCMSEGVWIFNSICVSQNNNSMLQSGFNSTFFQSDCTTLALNVRFNAHVPELIFTTPFLVLYFVQLNKFKQRRIVVVSNKNIFDYILKLLRFIWACAVLGFLTKRNNNL